MKKQLSIQGTEVKTTRKKTASKKNELEEIIDKIQPIFQQFFASVEARQEFSEVSREYEHNTDRIGALSHLLHVLGHEDKAPMVTLLKESILQQLVYLVDPGKTEALRLQQEKASLDVQDND